MHTTGRAVKNHISSELARELNVIYQTMYHLWFLACRRVLFDVNRYIKKSITRKWKYEWRQKVEVRVEESTETENKNK